MLNIESNINNISLCTGCKDNLYSKCTLPDNFYIKKVCKNKPDTNYPAIDIRACLPYHISEGPVTSTQAIGSQPTIALGQNSQYSEEEEITQPSKRKCGEGSIDSSQFGQYGLNGWNLLSQVPPPIPNSFEFGKVANPEEPPISLDDSAILTQDPSNLSIPIPPGQKTWLDPHIAQSPEATGFIHQQSWGYQ